MKMKVVFALLLALVFNLSMAALAEDKAPAADSIPVIPVSEGVLESVTLDEGAQDSETLLDGYVQRMIDSSLGQRQSKRLRFSSVGAGLEGTNKVIYDLLKPEIQSIADGTRTSTALEIPVSALTEKGVDCGPWSAKDLGVESTIDWEQYSVAEDATAAALDKLGIEVDSILFALKADCPYEMYWYGNRCSYKSFSVLPEYDADLEEYVLSCTESCTFKLRVSQDFADASDANMLTVDPSRITTAKAAIKKAQSIVAGSSGNVLQRITAYKDAICREVSYNDAAAGGGAPYGNPWQLIWVFDDDPSTKVVCEGYSKAFKYLVDLSNFGGSYDCILVTGRMTGDSGSGDHMWNLMRMDDGRNYLVDVTNCDEGTVGAPDELFMAYGPTGAWNDQYTFTPNNSNIVYKYDDEIIDAFGENRLTVSATAYHTSAYGITVDPAIENGTIQADLTEAAEDATVTLTVTPAEGYAVDTLSVVYNDGTGEATLTPKQDEANPTVYTFAMPGSDVTVRGTFRQGKPIVDSGTCGANLTWELDEEGTLTIRGTGKMTSHPWTTNFVKKVLIEDGVTSIGFEAFRDCDNLTGVTIPEGVTSIGSRAFYGCSMLSSISLPESVTSIDSQTFYGCGGLTFLTLPKDLTSIGSRAFYGCSSLMNLEIPKDVTSIGEWAFQNCRRLTSMILPDGVTSIGPQTFSGCKSMTKVTIPQGVTSIGYSAFSGCSSLIDLTIPDGLESIGEWAFLNCNAKRYASMGSDGAITLSKAGYSFRVLGTNYDLKYLYNNEDITGLEISNVDKSVESVIIPEGVTSIATQAFYGCIDLRNLEIPDIVCSIGDSAFYNCNNLERVTIPSKVTSIGHHTFYGCSSLTSIKLPDGITSIGNHAFTTCSSLLSITIPDSVTDIGECAFSNCKNLKKAIIPASVNSIGNLAFQDWTVIYCYEYTYADDWATQNGYTVAYIAEEIDDIRTVTLSPDTLRLFLGEAKRVTADVFPAVKPSNIIWTCSDSSVVTVEDGLITALIPGTTTITATVGNASASVDVTVYARATGFAIPEEVWFVAKDSVTLPVTDIQPEGAELLLTWSSGEDSLVQVDENGVVTSNRPDSDVIIIATTDDGISRQCVAHVYYPVSALEFSQTKLTLAKGDITQLTANVTANTRSVINKLVTFGSNDEAVATVDEDGNVTAVGIGMTTITATAASGVSDSIEISVLCVEHTPVTDPAVAPTCTETGLTEGSHCEVCGAILTPQEIVPATGHAWGEVSYTWADDKTSVTASRVCGNDETHVEEETVAVTSEVTTPPTCAEKGKTTYSSAAFENEAFEAQTKVLEDVDALGHDLIHHDAQAATCTEKGWNAYDSCQREGCGYTTYVEIQATGHQLTAHAKVDSTCTATGTEAYWSCDVCHKLFSDENAANEIQNPVEIAAAHQLASHARVDSTCTATGTEAYWSCDVCHKLFSDENAANEIQNPVEIAASHQLTSHARVDSTCTATGTEAYWSCDVCQKLFSNADAVTEINAPTVIGVKAHTLTQHDQVDSTCTTTGTEAYWSCDVCQKLFSDAEGVTEINAPAVIGLKAHTLTKHNQVDATCSATGTEAYWSCDSCQKLFSDENASTEIEEPVEIDLLSHTEVIDAAVAPTCTEAGKTEGKHCSVCNAVLVPQEVVAALGHTEVIDSEAVEPTCTEVGYAKASHCSVCQAVLSTAAEIPAKGHTEVTDPAVAATCTQAGKTEGKHCSVCKAILKAQETVPATGHTEVVDAAVAPTCTEAGKTEGKHCSVCQAILKAQETIPATGHTEVVDAAVAPTCTEAGKTEGKHCSVCKAILTAQQTVPATGHTEVVDTAVAPTCTEAGKSEGRHCSICGAVLVEQQTIPATGHTEVIDSAVAATCTKDGKTAGKHCSVCNAVLVAQQTIPATGHTEVIDAAVAPTCTEAGKTEGKHCSVCNAVLVAQQTVPATGHNWGDPVYEWAADNSTVTAKRVCSNDGTHVESETVNTTAEVTAQATTTKMGQTTYTASFANGAFAPQTRTLENIPMLTPTVEPTPTSEPVKVKISECQFTVKDQTYTGKALKPAVKVTYNKAKLKKDTDYTVTYKNNTNIGVATVTVTGKGNYTGTKKLSFNINPKGTSFSKVKGGKQSITLTWKNPKNITGYEIQYSLKKDFSGGKTVKIKKAKTLTTTIKKLTGGQTYYVRIRAFTTVKKKGTFYSAWSKVKMVKTTGAKNNSSVAPLEVSMNVGEELDLKELIDGSAWESSDETVATVSADGIVKALAEGEVAISALDTNEEQITVVITISDENVLELDDVVLLEIDDDFGEEIQTDEELELVLG